MTVRKLLENHRANWRKLIEEDRTAKATGTLVGRYITHPYADGKAVYQIVNSAPRTVTVHVVTGIGDDWVLPAWGTEAKLDRKTVHLMLDDRDLTEEVHDELVKSK